MRVNFDTVIFSPNLAMESFINACIVSFVSRIYALFNSSSTSLGFIAVICKVISCAKFLNSSVRATKSVWQLSSISTPTFPLACTYEEIIPSDVSLPSFLLLFQARVLQEVFCLIIITFCIFECLAAISDPCLSLFTKFFECIYRNVHFLDRVTFLLISLLLFRSFCHCIYILYRWFDFDLWCYFAGGNRCFFLCYFKSLSICLYQRVY